MTAPRRASRDPERGAIAVMVAVMGVALVGFAALAVDIGYLYQRQRGLQASADACVMAGLPTLSNDTSSTGQTNAKNLATSFATANGYTTGGGTTVTTSATSSSLSITITAPQQLFFAGIFGLHSKSLTVSATGHVTPAVPAIFAGGTTCPPTATGLQLNGTGFSITGNVQSNSAVNYYTGGSNPTNGSVTYNAACGYNAGWGNPAPTGGTSNTGGSLPYPYSYTLASFPSCTFGSLTTPGDLSLGTPGPFWQSGGPSGGTLVSGVYCANGNITLGANTVTGTVTFVATGSVIIGSSSANLTAFSNGLIAFTTSSLNCAATPAINIGNSNVTLNGSFDAPNGCINAGGTTMTINGSLVGNEVQIGVGSSSVIDPAGGGGGANYYLFQ